MVRTVEGKHPGYFEAVIQLRDVSDEIYYYAKGKIESTGVHIAKIVELKNGWDIYISDNDFAKALGKKLQQKYGGEYKLTSSLFGRKDGKEIYRVTVLFRGVPFKKGDLVDYGGSVYKIKFLGKDIMLQEVKTGKKIHLKYKNISKVKIIE